MSKRFNGKTLFYIAALICVLCVSFASPVFAAASKPLTANDKGLVASSIWIANAAGQKILDAGGNAIDAAAAVGYALAVVHPSVGNIGGGGFALIRLASGDVEALDFREIAPSAMNRLSYVDKGGTFVSGDISTYRALRYICDCDECKLKPVAERDLGNASSVGYLAAGVPGSPAGLNEMVFKYGSGNVTIQDIIQPAIDLAEKGFPLTAGVASGLTNARNNFNHFTGSKKYFTKDGLGGGSFATGDIFKQTALAETLKRIQASPDYGIDSGFYDGKTADLIVDDMAKYPGYGIIDHDDLLNYKPTWRKPVQGTYRGFKIFSMSPPSSGGTHIIQMLNIIENDNVGTLGFQSVKSIWLMSQAMRQAYADRSEYMGDPDTAAAQGITLPLDKLTSKTYAKEIYDKILVSADIGGGKLRSIPSIEIIPGFGPLSSDTSGGGGGPGTETTHYSVIDSMGNAVGVTYTINSGWGCRAAIDGAGFFMNNELDDFECVPNVLNAFGNIRYEINVPGPNKRPLSSMSPTIVLRESDNSLFMVTGSPGGRTIINTNFHSIVNAIDHGMNISEVTAAPRTDVQWNPEPPNSPGSDRINYEPMFGFTKDTIATLSNDMGYRLAAASQGTVEAIMVGARTGTGRAITGAHDPRAFDPPMEVGLILGPPPVIETYIPVTSVDVTPKTLTLTSGATRTLTVSVIPMNATNRGITWTTSDSTLATVPNGVVTVNTTGKAGTVTITAIGEGNHTSSCVVTISPIAVTSVDLNRSTDTLESGASTTLTATVSPSNATSSDVTWSTSDNTLATVINGVVTANNTGKAGNVTITAAAGGRSGTCVVTISPVDVTGVVLNSSSVTMFSGTSETLSATVFPANATDQVVVWSTSDSSIATVTNGVVTANNSSVAGYVTITATSGTYAATCAVTVRVLIPAAGAVMDLPGGMEVSIPGGTIIDPDGTVTLPDNEGGTAVTPDGLVISIPGGTVIAPDGTITLPPNKEGSVELAGADANLPGGTEIWPDGTIKLPSDKGSIITTSEGLQIEIPGGSVIWPDGEITIPRDKSAVVTTSDGDLSIEVAGSLNLDPDGSVTLSNATVLTPDGTKLEFFYASITENKVDTPSTLSVSVVGESQITYPDGKTKKISNGVVKVNADGTINSTGKSGGGGCDIGFGLISALAVILGGAVIARRKF